LERKLKIVHLITRLELGGAQGNTIYTVEHLDPVQFEAHLWYGPGGFWDADVAKKIDASRRRRFRRLVRPLHPLFDLLVIFDLVRAFREAKPDIVHTHSSKAGIVGRIAARLARVPVIVHTFHGFGFNSQQKPWTRGVFIGLEKLSARWSDALVFVSQANWDEAKRLKIGSERRYARIRSGVDLKAYSENQNVSRRASVRKALELTDEPVVLTIGPFKPQKNLPDLILAAARLREKFSNVRVFIVGDGELRPQVESQIQELGLAQTVTLLGWRKDIPDLMAVADVFAMTSLWEGLPRALVEAMASSVPAVCYDTDGVRDLLSQGGGYLVPLKDVQALTEKIDLLLINKEEAKRRGAQGPAIVQSEFDIDEMVRSQERLYLKLISRS
jgi:glycosyltransferase involved in cell wall biosynthesis